MQNNSNDITHKYFLVDFSVHFSFSSEDLDNDAIKLFTV
jgi:hypothetical protein